MIRPDSFFFSFASIHVPVPSVGNLFYTNHHCISAYFICSHSVTGFQSLHVNKVHALQSPQEAQVAISICI